MKKLLLSIMLLVGLVATPGVASAQYDPLTVPCSGNNDKSVCQQSKNEDGEYVDPISGADGGGVIIKVIDMLGYVVGVASIIMVIFGGMKFITANGDASKVSSARDTILYALIGIAVFVSSRIIVQFVLSKL